MSGHRTAARATAAMAALFCAALTIGTGPAHAAPTAGPTVEFSGGSVLSLLVCRSEPSVSRLSVPAESRVTFVNRLGHEGILLIDGQETKKVGVDQAVPVVFHHGPVDVAMTFECSVGVVEEFRSLAVAVSPPVQADTGAFAAPTPSVVAPTAGGGAAPGAGETRQSGTGTARSPRPARDAEGGLEGDGPGAEGDVGGMIDPGAPPSAAGVPAPGGVAPAVVVEPAVAASGPGTPTGPAGLLALIATVCVVGVGAAAARAIMAERASRARFA